MVIIKQVEKQLKYQETFKIRFINDLLLNYKQIKAVELSANLRK